MLQFGGKSTKTSSDSKRHFTVVMRGKEHGLYISSTPSSAARKAVTKLCTANKGKKVEFSIREITQSSKKKTYGPYKGYIEKLKEPIELKGRVIRYNPVVKLGAKKDVQKGGFRFYEPKYELEIAGSDSDLYKIKDENLKEILGNEKIEIIRTNGKINVTVESVTFDFNNNKSIEDYYSKIKDGIKEKFLKFSDSFRPSNSDINITFKLYYSIYDDSKEEKNVEEKIVENKIFKIFKNKHNTIKFKSKIKYLLRFLNHNKIGSDNYLYFIWYCLNLNKLRSINKKKHKEIQKLYNKFFPNQQKFEVNLSNLKKELDNIFKDEYIDDYLNIFKDLLYLAYINYNYRFKITHDDLSLFEKYRLKFYKFTNKTEATSSHKKREIVLCNECGNRTGKCKCEYNNKGNQATGPAPGSGINNNNNNNNNIGNQAASPAPGSGINNNSRQQNTEKDISITLYFKDESKIDEIHKKIKSILEKIFYKNYVNSIFNKIIVFRGKTKLNTSIIEEYREEIDRELNDIRKVISNTTKYNNLNEFSGILRPKVTEFWVENSEEKRGDLRDTN